MKKTNGQLIFSPSDLCVFMESRFASWMDRYNLERPGVLTPDEITEDQQVVMKKGIEHEKDFVTRLVENGREVIEIPGTGNRFDATLAAIQEGVDIIYQGCLVASPFEGFSDFLARIEGSSTLGTHHYEVWDTKLGKKPKPYYIIQLCCYADMLEQLQGRRPEHFRVILGTGESRSFRTDDYFFYYQCLKASFLAFMDEFSEDEQPPPEQGADHGSWQSHADDFMERVDHLCRTANITKSQVKRLEAAEVTTMTELSATTMARVPGIQDDTFRRLREQAELQIASCDREIPEYRVIPPNADNLNRGLALLPPPSELDVFFDMEGYPLVEGGLEYLFGATYLENGSRQFIDWWAHTIGGRMSILVRVVSRVLSDLTLPGVLKWANHRRHDDGIRNACSFL